MTSPYAISAAVNSLSIGQVTVSLLRELFKRGESPAVLPIMGSNPDLSAQAPDPIFEQRLNACIVAAHQRYNRKAPALRHWHVASSLESPCIHGNHLLTYVETDSLTPTEVNVLRQQAKVYVTSSFTAQMMGQYGIAATYVPIGFDAHNHRVLDKRPKVEGATSFLLPGKAEQRKGTYQVLRTWAKRYGNNPAYRLNCAIHNHFLPADRAQAMVAEALGGKHYWNIVFHPWAPDNATFNATLQSSEIVIALSGGEGRDLPCYHATAMGAWPVAMRAHAYLDYLNDSNAVLVNPSGKRPAADGVHFAQGGPFNQGNFFGVTDDEMVAGFEAAEKRAAGGPNTAGLALQQTTYSQAVDILLADLRAAMPA